MKIKKKYHLIMYVIGLCYFELNDFCNAEKYFSIASVNAPIEDLKIKYNLLSIKCIFELNQDKALEKLLNLINDSKSNESKDSCYKLLSSLYEKINEKEKQFLAIQKIIEFNPNDVNILFSSAYNNNFFSDLKILDYKNLLNFKPNLSEAVNNIALEYKKVGLINLGIESLKKSVKNNNTLSSANLALEYINAGFYEEANNILNLAKKEENCHKNIGLIFKELKEKEENEKNEETNIINKAIIKQRFIRNYADAYFHLGDFIKDFYGNWTESNKGYIDLKIENLDKFKINILWNEDFQLKEYRIHGNVTNMSAKISIESKYIGHIEDEYSFEKYGYIYLNENSKKLNLLMFKDSNIEFEIIEFSKK